MNSEVTQTDLGVTLILSYGSTLKEPAIFLNVFHFNQNYINHLIAKYVFLEVWEV